MMLCSTNEQLAAVTLVYEQAYLCLVGLPSSGHCNDPFASIISITRVRRLLWQSYGTLQLRLSFVTRTAPRFIVSIFHVKQCVLLDRSYH